MKVIRFYETGSPEVLRYEDIPTPEPGPKEVLVHNIAIGVNLVDISRRSGKAPLPPGSSMPFTPGGESAGTIESLGADVTEFQLGEQVLVRGGAPGYSEFTVATANQVYRIPPGLDPVEASTIATTFFTAWGVLVNSAKLQRGETILIHSCAGGVGSALVQVAKHIGATVIGTSSQDSKLEWAKEFGMDHSVNYSTQDFVHEVAVLTEGKGVQVVADGVGGETTVKSLKSLQRGGRLVIYGVSGGSRTAEFILPELWFANHTIIGGSGNVSRIDAESILARFSDGTFRSVVDKTWPLSEAAVAHQYIEDRLVRGKVALTVT